MKPHNSNFVVITLSQPVLWTRNITNDGNESWMLLPDRKYVVNAGQIGNLETHLSSISDIKNTSLYKPFNINRFNNADRVLIDRYRDRGIGDLLFLTGPMSFLHYLSGGAVNIDMFALADRGAVLSGHPSLKHKSPFYGPLRYEDLAYYDHHLLVDTVTEYVDDAEQPNVYDALFTQMGFDPSKVPAVYKRPSVHLNDADLKNVDQFMFYTWAEKKVDLRQDGFYIVCPCARSSLRAMPYGTWLKVIDELSKRRPVLVVADTYDKVPATDMTFGEFVQRLPNSNNVVNAIGKTPLRVLLGLMKHATAVGTMDSGPLYMAQAVRTPAVSVWGPHSPSVRLGYDPEYMNLAVWNKAACRRSPCFAFSKFPADKCPMGQNQIVCHPLLTVRAEDILAKFQLIEESNAKR